MTKTLKRFSGKKTIIQAILVALVGYCAAKGWIGEQEVILFGAINLAIFGGASLLTTQMYKQENKPIIK